jgi:hypothetical protein
MVGARYLLSALVVSAIGIAACIEDLPPPAKCPPAEKRAMGDCLSAITAAGPLCSSDATHECLQGPRASCACATNECPEEKATCFVDECPAAVRAIVPDARCLAPPSSDFFAAPTKDMPPCLCGCPACVRRCDGRGPSIAVKFPQGAGDPSAPIVVSLTSLPSAGKLGVYVRLRGIAELAVVVARFNTALDQQPLFLREQNEKAFVERTFEFSTRWTETDESRRPDKVALLIQAGPTIAEIDCVIPYVRP